jgi:hypothetical protein
MSIDSILHDSCTFYATRSIRRCKKIVSRLIASCPALELVTQFMTGEFLELLNDKNLQVFLIKIYMILNNDCHL